MCAYLWLCLMLCSQVVVEELAVSTFSHGQVTLVKQQEGEVVDCHIPHPQGMSGGTSCHHYHLSVSNRENYIINPSIIQLIANWTRWTIGQEVERSILRLGHDL